MAKPVLGVCLMIWGWAAFPSNVLQAGEPCVGGTCEGCPSCCEDSSSCRKCCHSRKSIGIGLKIPSIRWGISLGCDGSADCEHGCLSCGHCRKDCWWTRMEPPRGPLVFSVPAVTVSQQALAITPTVQPHLAPVVPQAACQPPEMSATDKLLLEALLRRLETAQPRSAPLAAPSASASSAGLDQSTEARLTELENRLDRILQVLEK